MVAHLSFFLANIVYATRLFYWENAENAIQAAKILFTITPNYLYANSQEKIERIWVEESSEEETTLTQALSQAGKARFCRKVPNWTLEDWKIIWSDKIKINYIESDRRKYVWKQVREGLSNRLVEKTVKFGGGNLMMWDYMRWEKIRYVYRIQEKMDEELYEYILKNF